ncbi:MAG: hypothetical protein QNJ55_10885 [Xenococcus sp. MO_188.B8]|nr:hypothetical protein [Xenococcus sp. MO_188.B8]
MSSIYVIAIGGTGAKCVEALAHLAAAGILANKPLRVLFVDPDEANGNLVRARQTIEIYNQCYRLISQGREDTEQCYWMKNQIELFKPDTWSPLNTENRTISSIFNYHDYQTKDDLGHPLRNIFDVFYNANERELKLNLGFRGRPAIGSAVMSQLDLNGEKVEEPWQKFLNQVETDAISGTPEVFVYGSAFGGTGASGFSVISRLIANRLEKDGYRNRVKLGGALLLPYFFFPLKEKNKKTKPGRNGEQEIYAQTENFILNTASALHYYQAQDQEAFDTIYLLGNKQLLQVNQEFRPGRRNQKNDPNFLELYAALAAQHFSNHNPKERGEVVVISRHAEDKITWEDLPIASDVKSRLVNTTRFAFAWLTDMNRALKKAREINFENFPKLAPWSIYFFRHSKGRADLPDFTQELANMPVINRWCQSYLEWLGKLHRSTGEEIHIQLFNREALMNNDGKFNSQDTNFHRLVLDDSQYNLSDTVQKLKQNLSFRDVMPPNRGLVGLARALFVRCEINWRSK